MLCVFFPALCFGNPPYYNCSGFFSVLLVLGILCEGFLAVFLLTLGGNAARFFPALCFGNSP